MQASVPARSVLLTKTKPMVHALATAAGQLCKRLDLHAGRWLAVRAVWAPNGVARATLSIRTSPITENGCIMSCALVPFHPLHLPPPRNPLAHQPTTTGVCPASCYLAAGHSY